VGVAPDVVVGAPATAGERVVVAAPLFVVLDDPVVGCGMLAATVVAIFSPDGVGTASAMRPAAI
jgi:hypothetical protein